MKRITLLYYFFMFFFLAATQAQVTTGKLSPYTKSFLSSIKEGSTSVQQRTLYKRAAVRQSNSRDYINAYIYLKENADTQALIQEGVKISTRTKNIITALIPVDVLETVAALPEVKYVQMGTPVHKNMDKARITSNVEMVQNGTVPLTGPYFGKDVVVGIIDNGFEYGHPNFYNKDHTAYRVKRVWDQNVDTGTPPTGFSYGVEYINQDSILKVAYDLPDTSHGTHVAGIAAGADRTNGNTYYGIAGDADIVLVSYLSDDTDIANGIKYIYDYATSVGKPCVINLSLGSYMGPHDGTSSFDSLTDEMQGKGRLLVGAAGNEGQKYTHISKTFSSTDSICKAIFQFKDNFACDVWGEEGKNFKVQLCLYDPLMNAIYTSPEYSTSEINNGKKLYLATPTNQRVKGYVKFYTETNPQNNKPNAYFTSQLTSDPSIPTGYHLGLIIKATEGTVNAWGDDSSCSFTSLNQSGWSGGNNDCSIGEIGGTGKQIVSVGAYTTKTSYTNLNNETYNSTETLNALASFSSTGPTIDGRMKPEITAPGSLIVSSVSSYDTDPTNRVKATTVEGNTYYYGMMEGTSMSTPYVTGVLATWLQANPELTPTEVKSILQKTAINDSYTGNILSNGNNTWGYGKIDAYNGILEIIKQSTSIEDMPVQPQPILMYTTPDNQQLLKFLFTQGDTNVQINLFNVNGQKLQSRKITGITSKQEETVDLGNLPKGLYLIKITGDKLNQVFKASTK
ncbi:S8 family peptidase [uncultured Bacteroides sp.]|uniref:S8 family peptidase n=1 Tax=uncultured Bacteroides sp. TaxID=162156 RepID=UPI002AAA9CB1|nr:S8 family peptidase [uncultured Bacteroides sp.]